MNENPSHWEKENIRLFEAEAADREFAKVQSDCASDSELLRQSLRNTEQLISDTEQGKTFYIKRVNGFTIKLTPDIFKDEYYQTESAVSIRRSLMLNRSSKERINKIREKLSLDDISAVSRFALRFFSRIVREAVAGGRFFVSDSSGTSTEVRFGAFTPSPDGFSPLKNDKDEDDIPQPGGELLLPTRPKTRVISQQARRHSK